MPPTVDVSCPACGSECAAEDNYCWSCGSSLPLDGRHESAEPAVLISDSADDSDADTSRRLAVVALLVVAAVIVSGVSQLGRDRAGPQPGSAVPLESLAEMAADRAPTVEPSESPVERASEARGSGTAAGSDSASDADSPGAGTGSPSVRIDVDRLRAGDLDTGYLVFADADRTIIEVVDLANAATTSRPNDDTLVEGSRLLAVSDLGLIVETVGAVNRWHWDGTMRPLGDEADYVGGNRLTIRELPNDGQNRYLEFETDDDLWSEYVPTGSAVFIVDDAVFTQSDTAIMRTGPDATSWETVGQGVIAAAMGDGLLAFDCVTGNPDAEQPCLMDIYQADGTRVVSSRTASQLRWNLTAGGRNDAGLFLSHNGEMLAEPTQVGLGVWNSSGGTLRRISGTPLASLHWTADDRAIVGLGPVVDGWAPVMELDISRGTTLPVGIEVAGLDLMGLAAGAGRR